MQKVQSKKIAFLNIFGSVGYVACLLQWLWAAMVLLPAIIESPLFKNLFSSTPSAPPQVVQAQASNAAGVPGFVTGIAFVIAIGIVIGSIYIIAVKMPRGVSKVGERATHTAAAVLTPVIVRHFDMPAKQRREVPEAIIVAVKLFMAFVPLTLLLFTQGISVAVSFDIIMFIGVVLFSWSFCLFTLQFALSRLLGVDYKSIR